MEKGIKGKKEFYKMVFYLVFPMALQNLINVAITSADVLMLGRVGETALSGASLAGQAQFIMTLLFFGLTSGASVLTAQYWGKKDIVTIERVIGIALRLSLIASVVFTLVVQIFPVEVMRIFTPEEAVIAEGVRYLRIVSFAYPMMAVTMIYLNIMRSVERVVISTVVYSLSLFTNIGLNAIFIFGLLGCPAMGVAGAALGTLCARTLELVVVLIYARRMNREVRMRVKDVFRRDPVLFRDFIKYSIPVTLNELLWGLGTSMSSVVIGHLGSPVVAANSVAQVVRQLAMVVSFGIANAAAIVIGKAIGEENNSAAREYSKRFVKLSIVSGIVGAGVVLAASPIVRSALTLSDEARGYLTMMMFVMAYFVLAQTYNTTMIVGIFRAGGDTKYGLIVDAVTMWGGSILLGAAAAFLFHWSVPIVYMLLLSDELLKIPFSTHRYRSMAWLKNITREHKKEMHPASKT